MAIFNQFSDFESAVISEVSNKKVNSSSLSGLLGGALGAICGGPVGAAVGLGLAHSSLGLNERMYRSYIRSVYQKRFEEHKSDASYINGLVKEAVSELIKL